MPSPECQVHQVVQHRHVEDSEKGGIGVMAGEGELLVVRGDARNKAEHADGQEHRADCKGSFLDGRPKLRAGFGRAGRMRSGHNRLPLVGHRRCSTVLEANGPAVIPELSPCKRVRTELI